MGLRQGATFCGHSLKVIATFCLNMSRYSIQIYLQYLVRYPLMNLHLSSVWELHVSPPLKLLIRISRWDSFKGGRLWHPRCQFRVMSEDLFLILDAQWKFLFSRSCMCLIIQISHSHLTKFEVNQSHRRPNLEPIKTFNSRHECKLDNQSQFINLV